MFGLFLNTPRIVTHASPLHTVVVLHTVNYFSVYFFKRIPYREKCNKEFELNEACFITHKVFYLKYFLRSLVMFSWATGTIGLYAVTDRFAIK